MENKICPLLWASPADMISDCKGCECAWYVPPLHRGEDGRCAVQALGALPYIGKKVAELL